MGSVMDRDPLTENDRLRMRVRELMAEVESLQLQAACCHPFFADGECGLCQIPEPSSVG